MRGSLTCSLVGIMLNGATVSAGLCSISIFAIATLLGTQVCCDSYLSLATSGTRLRSTVRRIDSTTITRAMSHGCLDWRICRRIYSAGLMTPSIKFVRHSQALKAISLVHHDEGSTLTHWSRFILGGKVCMGLRLRQCYCQMV